MDRTVDWLGAASLPLLGLGLFLLMLGAEAIGAGLRRNRRARMGEGEGHGQEEIILSAVLGLLALLMGFTFSIALDRFEIRRQLVLKEANAIGTAYLRAQLLEEPDRGRMSRLLVRYTDNRIVLARAPAREARALLKINDALVTEIWREVKVSYPAIRHDPFAAVYVDAINSMIDIGSARVVARLARVPPAVLIVLVVYVLTAAAVAGYVLQDGRSRFIASFLLALLSLFLVLIVDINRPAAGAVREGQGPMESLRQTMTTWSPATFDARLTPGRSPAGPEPRGSPGFPRDAPRARALE